MTATRRKPTLRAAGSRKGGPALEFALMAPVFIGVLLLAFEILYAIAARSVVDTALEEASRKAVTGGPTPSNSTARLNAFTSEFYAVTSPMIAQNRIVLAVMACATMDMLNNNPAGCRASDPGATGEVVRFSATYSHRFLAQQTVCNLLAMTNCPPLTMNAQIVRRNEPF
jgi:hypothetical protein